MPNGKPNILVIWGDDIGISNLSCYSDGMMGYRTPNIDRIANEGMRFTDSYGEQSCTAGRAAFISGQSVYRTGMSKVGVPGVDIGWAAEDPDHRRTAQAARLRHRPVRQEPLRRPEQVPADRARLRRVLRQPLPPQRRGGTRAVRLPAQGPVPAALRAGAAARRAEVQGHRRGVDRTRRRKVRSGRQADHRGHRPADRQAHGDHRRRHRRPHRRLHQAPARGGHPVLRVVQLHAHAPLHTPEAREQGTGRDVAVRVPRRDDRPRQERGHGARRARRPRHRRRHDRHLLHRQRAAPQLVAGRRHHAVPQREEHQLGRRLPCSGVDPLARKDQGGQRLQRHHPAPRLAAHPAGRRG